jgi:hypothetical protein
MRAPNASLLASRDPASLAALGLSPVSFGHESVFAGEFGEISGDFGDDDDSDVGDDYSDMGADFGAVVRAAARGKVDAGAVIRSAMLKKAKSGRRATILHPNQGSDVKVERYTFAISTPIVIGVLSALDMSGNPDTNFRPQRVTMNAPTVMFATISEIKVANVSTTVGGGTLDAYQFNANAVGQTLDLPTITPANRVRVLGTYTGFVPPGFVVGSTVTFSAAFTGPASVMA